MDIRLICATNTALTDLADEAKFRKDLVYRINTVDLLMPPLRDRGEDIALLAKHFIDLYGKKYGKTGIKMDPGFVKKLKGHMFPGNVRELQYALERAVIMTEDVILKAQDLVFSAIETGPATVTVKETNLEALEKSTILKVIEKNSGNISKSARELGITRAALYRRLEKHDL